MQRARWILRLVSGMITVLVVTAASTTVTDARPRSRALVNQAIAVDTSAGHRSHRVAWMVRTTAGGVLPSNYARAQTWCNDCRTTAIAMQIVVMSRVSGPTASWNHSVAVNSNCAGCSTAAAAFQFAVISNAKVALTPSGVAQLGALRRQLEQIAGSDGAPADINVGATGVAARVLGVLQSELRVDTPATLARGFTLMSASQPFEIRFQHETNAANG